jgi:hypothetical protein
MRGRTLLLITMFTASGLGGLTPVLAQPVAAASCGAGSTTLMNGGFETPVITPDSFSLLDSSLVPPWQTTDDQNQVEIWSTGYNGVPSDQGNQFAELNANTPGTLYQDLVTTPGATMTWTLAHRGRSGDDTMKVLIGDSATADVTSDTGWNYFSPDLTDGTTAWGKHTGTYVVPAGQSCTRFAFRAVSSAGGDPSFGNLLDTISFQIGLPSSPPGSPAPSSGVSPTSQPATPPATATQSPTDGPDGNRGLPLAAAIGLAALLVGSLLLGRRARGEQGRRTP